MKKFACIAVCFLAAFSLVSCSSDQSNPISVNEENTVILPEVSVSKVKVGSFYSKLISNGKAYALENYNVTPPVNGIIESILVSNGTSVKTGDTLCVFANESEKADLKLAKIGLENARINLLDELILAGHRSFEDTIKMDEDALSYLRIKSGYENAKLKFLLSKRNLDKTFLIAQIDGVIINMNLRKGDFVTMTDVLFNLYDDKWGVDFYLMESDLKSVFNGQIINVMPFNNNQNHYSAEVIEINPFINSNGLFNVKARMVSECDLLLGQNVRLEILKEYENQIIVPIESIVQRSNRSLVFTYSNGMAKWNYIEINYENQSHCAINAPFSDTTLVIISNNILLSHNTRVKLSNP